MLRSCYGELLVLGKRPATWTLAAVFALTSVFFLYAQPYLLPGNSPGGGTSDLHLAEMLPAGLIGNVLAVFPWYGGILVLFLGAIAAGGEYGGGTLKTILTQRPARWKVFLGRLVALGVVLLLITAAVFSVGAVFSLLIAWREGAPVDWPGAWDLALAVGAGWCVLAVWAALGAFLAVLVRGAALAIGVGVVYALVSEGLIVAYAGGSGALAAASKVVLRSNAYSFVAPFGGSMTVVEDGPGAVSASALVAPGLAALVLAAYGLVFVLVAALLFLRRDVA